MTLIDVHNHWMPQELVDNLVDYLPDGYTVREANGQKYIIDPSGLRIQEVSPELFPDIKRRLERMDELGIDLALLSPGCTPSFLTMKAARLLNDACADLLKDHGDRLQPMVNVPPFGHPDVLEEMERAADLGLRGVAMTTNFGGQYPDEEVYRPFLQKAAELDLPVFVHAAGAPVQHRDMLPYNLVFQLGRSHDLTLTTLRLLASGVMDEIPNLKLVVAHLAGFTFLNFERFFGATRLKDRGLEYPLDRVMRLLERMLFDTAPSFWYTSKDVAFGASVLGADRIVMGSDYPHGDMAVAAEHVRNAELPDEDRAKIAWENAVRFYNLEGHRVGKKPRG